MNTNVMEQLSGRYDGLRTSVLTYYQACAPREQKLLIVTSVLLPLVIVVFGLILPTYDRITELEHEVAIAKQQFSEARAIAEKLQKNPGAVAPRGDTLVIVERVSRELQIRKFITHMKPVASLGGKKSLMIQMKGLPYSGAIRFLSRIGGVGISLEQLKLRSTDRSGIVDVELKLK